MLVVCAALTSVHSSREANRRAPLPAIREARFAIGVSKVYARLKLTQGISTLGQLAGEASEKQQRRWAAVHGQVGQDLYELCASLGGAYVKVGQFFATRPDIVPEEWCNRLGVLCDAVDPMPGETARSIAMEELHRAGQARGVLREWNDVPLGSASVAQVHAAVLEPAPASSNRWWALWAARRPLAQRVAVKVLRPEAEMYFARDLAAVRHAAAFVQRFELSIDLLSCIEELRDRVDLELDLRVELRHLKDSGSHLRYATDGVIVAPKAFFGTQRCLITELCDATPVSKLARLSGMPPSTPKQAAAEPSTRPANLPQETGLSENLRLEKARALRRGVREIYAAYGQMVLCSSTFHADPHPGNFLIPNNYRRALLLTNLRQVVPHPLRQLLPQAPPLLYLVDWGQCGGPTPAARRKQLASLVLELAAADGRPFRHQPERAARVSSAVRALGVELGPKGDVVEQAELARGMFDLYGEVELHDGIEFDNGSIDVLPKDLFLVLKVAQMLSGLGRAAEKSGAAGVGRLSLAWLPYAKQAIADAPADR